MHKTWHGHGNRSPQHQLDDDHGTTPAYPTLLLLSLPRSALFRSSGLIYFFIYHLQPPNLEHFYSLPEPLRRCQFALRPVSWPRCGVFHVIVLVQNKPAYSRVGVRICWMQEKKAPPLIQFGDYSTHGVTRQGCSRIQPKGFEFRLPRNSVMTSTSDTHEFSKIAWN